MVFVVFVAALGMMTGMMAGAVFAEVPAVCSRLAPLPVPISDLRVHTQRGVVISLEVEVASTPAARRRGLMCRTYLPAQRGMLFILPAPRETAMWMKNTLIPLDMLFVAPTGRILAITENASPLSEERIVSPGAVKAVLELAGGSVRRYAISIGDVLEHGAFTSP